MQTGEKKTESGRVLLGRGTVAGGDGAKTESAAGLGDQGAQSLSPFPLSLSLSAEGGLVPDRGSPKVLFQPSVSFRLVASRRVAWASPVVLALDPGVCHEGARVRRQPASGATQVVVDLHDLLNARRDQQGRRQPLLHRKNDALARSDPDRGRSKLCRANERERKKG